MVKKQTQKLVSSLVEHQHAFDDMPTESKQWVIQNTVLAINSFKAAIEEVTGVALSATSKKVLSNDDGSGLKDVHDSMITVVAEYDASAVSEFDASEHFNNGQSSDARKLMSYLSDRDVPVKKLKLLEIESWGNGFPVHLMRLFGYEPVVSIAHMHQFARASVNGKINFFDKKNSFYDSFTSLVLLSDGRKVFVNLNRDTHKHDKGDASFLSCEKPSKGRFYGRSDDWVLVSV